MKLLFKAEGGDDAKVNATNFKNHYPEVNGSTEFSEIKSRIRQATTLSIIPYLGLKMYNKLANDYETDDLAEENSEIINLLQDAIAHYTIYVSLPYMPFIVSSTGFQKSQPTEGATAPSFGERKDTRWNAHLDADRFLDEALKMLENTEGEYFQPYRDHVATNFKTSTFFKTANALDDHLNIQGSRRALAALVPYLKKSEESEIEPLLGEELFAKLQETGVNTVEKGLLKLVRKFVAQNGLYESVPFLTLVVESDGFKIVSRGDGIEERNGLKHAQHENAILRLRDAAKENALQYKIELMSYLWKNKEALPLWKTSDYYVSLTTNNIQQRIITTGDGGVFL